MEKFSLFVPAYDQVVYAASPGGKLGDPLKVPKELAPRVSLAEALADLEAPDVAGQSNRYVLEYVFEGTGEKFDNQKAAAEQCARNRVPLILIGRRAEEVAHVVKRHTLPGAGPDTSIN